MRRQDFTWFGSTVRRGKRLFIVPLGTILIFVFLVSPAKSREIPDAEDKTHEKIPHHEMKRLRDGIRRLRETTDARRHLQKEQNQRMDRLSELKIRNEKEDMSPNKLLTRKEMEKTSGELHQILEKDRRMAQEQKTIIQKLLSNREEIHDIIETEIKELRKRIKEAEKNDAAAPEIIEQWEKNLEDLENLQSLLEILEKNPRSLSMLGFWKGVPPASPVPPALRPGRFSEQRKGDPQTERGTRDRAGVRIFQQMNQLEKQIQFLKNQLERTEANFNDLRNALNRIQERRPEILEELRMENPERFPEIITEPDPDFDAPPGTPRERRRMRETPPSSPEQ